MSTKEDIAERLRQLEKSNGRLEPEDVIKDARDPASPLHSYFEWNDAEAARQHRLIQARELIRSVKIEVVVRDVPMNVVRYVRDDGGYQNIVNVHSNEERSREAVISEMQRVVQAAKRAKAVATFLGTPEDLEAIIRIASSVVVRARSEEITQGAA